MNIWENTVITEKGLALQTKLLNGAILKITKVEAGTGKATDIRKQTAVMNVKQVLSLQTVKKKEKQIVIPVLLENLNLSESYELWQIGFYAEDPDEGEILYCLAQASEGKIIPSNTESPGFSITWNFHFKISDEEKIDMQIEPAGLVSIETFNEKLGQIDQDIEILHHHVIQKDNPHGVTKSQVGLGNVPNVSTNNQTPTYSDVTTLTNLVSGEKLSEAFPKVKLAVANLINHMANKSNPHGVTKNQIGLGNVPNVSTNDQILTYGDITALSTLTSGEKLSEAFSKIKLAISNLMNHMSNKNNPHGVTKSQLGLGEVENKSGAAIRGEMTASEINNALGYIAARQSEVTQLSSDLLEKVYPVGSIYFSVIDKNPGILFGGTWERFAKGQTLIGVNESDNDFESVKKTGGSKTHVHSTNDHTLTSDEIPAHNHSVNAVNISSSGSHGHTTYYLQDNSASGSGGRMGTSGNHTKERTDVVKTGGAHTHTVPAHNTNNAGNGGSHNHGNTGSASNLSPYITTFIWTRIA